MGLHVYGIVPAGTAPPEGLAGLDGASVELLDVGALGLWFSRHSAPPVASVAAARDHNRVLGSVLSADLTPVPARFGQWFGSEESAAERVGAHEARWVAELARFRGRAEFGVRASLKETTAGRDSAAQDVHLAGGDRGTQHMMALARKHAEAARRRDTADRIAAAVAGGAGALVAETRVQALDDGAAVSHLVAWADVADYHSAMRRLEAERSDLHLLFTGPWPPYSFVNDG